MHRAKFVIICLGSLAAIIAVTFIFSRVGIPRPLTKKNQMHYSIFLNVMLLVYFSALLGMMLWNIHHVK